MPGLNPTPQDYEQFIEITGADRSAATHFLENGTTLQGAIEDFFAAGEAGIPAEQDEDLDDIEGEDDLMAEEEQPVQPVASSGSGAVGGPRTLGGQAAESALPEGWGKKVKKTGRVGEWTSGGSARRPGEIATLRNTGEQPQAHDSDSDDDEERRKKGEKELYTGGEKSGLAVENPDRAKKGPQGIVEQILKQAEDNTPQRDEAPARPSFFGGSGNTLGSEDTPPAPPAAAPPAQAGRSSLFDSLLGGLMGGAAAPPAEEEEEEVQTRHLIFWRTGFSIEDGPLMLYDTPGNSELLRAIQSGRAPPSLFGVRYGQPLQVEVAQRTNEDYAQQPKKKVVGFAAGGNRLGSATPDVSASSSSAPAPQPVSQGGSTGRVPEFQVDNTLPTTSVQLRLADGSKLVAKVNLTHTIRDLRNFIMAASVDSNSRPFILQTTFPSKELSDETQTIEQAGLKNAVVVQRFS